MINLLRKIRLNLMTDTTSTKSGNKTNSYLLYAFGEIFLVVIGILIALQINNWNEGRIENKLESTFMQSMLEDLRTDVAIYADYKVRNTDLYQCIDSLVYSLKRQDRKAHAKKSSYWGRTMTTLWVHAQPIERTFEQMKSSGQLELISNKNVADQISNYYNSQYKLDVYNDAALIWLESYLKAMGKVFDGEVLLRILKEGKPVDSEHSALITDDAIAINELLASAQYVYGAIKLSEEITEERKIEAQKLILLLQEEYKLN